jgi:vitamin B12 transporter
MRVPALLAASLLPVFPCVSAAQTVPELEPIIITATRTEVPADKTSAAVTVITAKDIAHSQARSVQDLLAGTPGLGVSNSGGPGKTTSVYLRGTNAGHVLVMIDGVKIGSATLGQVAFQDLPIDLIERIEIVRGPRAALYGSEAIGGVIQIFTKKGGPQRTTLSATGGSFGTMKSSGTVSGSIGDDVWYNFGISGHMTDGIDVSKLREPDKDSYENLSGTGRMGWHFAPWGEIETNWLRTRARNEYDPMFDGGSNQARTTQEVLGTTLTITPFDYYKATLRAAQSKDYSKDYLNGVFVDRFDTRREMLSWQNELTAGPGLRLVTGVDWLDDHVSGSTPYDVSSRTNTGVFGQLLGEHGAHAVQLALRHDENEQFGGHITGNIGWGYRITDGLKLTASYGTAFKAPTFNDLYYPYSGNPTLRPEQSKSAEIGISGDAGGVRWAVNVFETRATDLINWQPVDPAHPEGLWLPSNVDSARIRGIETTLSTRVAAWDLRGNLTLLDPVSLSGENAGKVLINRAQAAWAVHADHSFGDWSVGASLRGEGVRYANAGNTIELDPYAVVDLRAEYKINDDWRAQLKLENVFDTDYETAYNYNQPGRSVFVTLRYAH